MSSSITLAQAQAQLASLLAAQTNNMLTVTINGRSVSYRNAADIADAINYWSRIEAGIQRQSAGQSRHGFAGANFQNRQ